MTIFVRMTLAVAAIFLLATPVAAQFSTGTGKIATGGRGGGGPSNERPAEPAALPGAQSRGSAPLMKAPSEMGPTESLFDAVNRGDIAAARDAVTRGADMEAHNALGLSALELAVDLGQNDIAFMLLSLRDAGGGKGGSGRAAAATAAKPASAPKPVAAKPPPQKFATAPANPSPTPVRDGGGAANTNAGFLGFGGR